MEDLAEMLQDGIYGREPDYDVVINGHRCKLILLEKNKIVGMLKNGFINYSFSRVLVVINLEVIFFLIRNS